MNAEGQPRQGELMAVRGPGNRCSHCYVSCRFANQWRRQQSGRGSWMSCELHDGSRTDGIIFEIGSLGTFWSHFFTCFTYCLGIGLSVGEKIFRPSFKLIGSTV